MSLSLTSMIATTQPTPAESPSRASRVDNEAPVAADAGSRPQAAAAFAKCLNDQDTSEAPAAEGDGSTAQDDEDAAVAVAVADAALLAMPWLQAQAVISEAVQTVVTGAPAVAPVAAPQAAAPGVVEAGTDLAPPVTTWSAAVDSKPVDRVSGQGVEGAGAPANGAAAALMALLSRQSQGLLAAEARADAARSAAGPTVSAAASESDAGAAGEGAVSALVSLLRGMNPESAAVTAARSTGAEASAAEVPAQAPISREVTGLAAVSHWSADLTASLAAPAAADAGVANASDGRLALPGEGRAWQQPLLQALGDRLQVQIAARSEQARLHLEPPQLGRIEIEIRQQGGALQVQLSASNDEVRQQLRQISEPLRHDLVQRHSGEVSVQVGAAGAGAEARGRGDAQAQSQSQGGQSRDAQRQPGRAWDEQAETATTFNDALASQGLA